jgi:hypothetical protein
MPLIRRPYDSGGKGLAGIICTDLVVVIVLMTNVMLVKIIQKRPNGTIKKGKKAPEILVRLR